MNSPTRHYVKLPSVGSLIYILMFAAPKNLLVVDDETSVLHFLTRALEIAGYRVFPATGGLEALEVFVEHSAWDAVILDRALPDLNGEDLARRLKAAAPDLPIILMTGNDDGTIARHLFHATLAKPFRASELLTCLAQMPNASSVA